jgi:hypothetical protein
MFMKCTTFCDWYKGKSVSKAIPQCLFKPEALIAFVASISYKMHSTITHVQELQGSVRHHSQ